MAELVVDGEQLVLRLRPSEKWWSFHGDVRVPIGAIRQIRIPGNVWLELRGWRVTGTYFPGYIAMGRRRHGSGYDFSMLFKHRPAIIMALNAAEFGEIAVSVDDAEATSRRLSAAAGIAPPQ